MNITRTTLTLAATTGDITAVTSSELTGQILSVHLQMTGATLSGFATTAAITLASNVSGQTVWAETLTTLVTTSGTTTITRLPRQVAHTTAGVALTSTQGLEAQPITLFNEKIVVTCTTVGSGTKAATLIIHSG